MRCARWCKKMSDPGLTSQVMAFRCHRDYLYIYIVYVCNIFIKKTIEGTLYPVFYGYLSTHLSARNVRCAHWSKKMSNSGLTMQNMARRCNRNYIYMYLTWFSYKITSRAGYYTFTKCQQCWFLRWRTLDVCSRSNRYNIASRAG